ncbi:sperm axonemal maintenance protein CFAP97D1 isoform X1 [Dicentrarchus labrax]|uniref:sperm axonemal maintenance protein CFAP97D1 isoform X1 n=1 Tax=Dicentrarchus labrax TaxID=13489 RepID=UPI0021F51843|nr:sperm axonemal maintenance protein CFAP97D1 isoform X1 [Dicentrarchus labrax]
MKSCDLETPGQLQTVRTMTHQAYQPLLPSGNKYLQQKWDMASYDLHRGKVKSAKPTINTTPPKTYDHLTLRLKKLKLEEEWTTKIERENNMLMEKISRIMRTTGGVDNRKYYDRKSLGKEKRQLELLRITKENQMILFRLSQCRPHYNVKSWHEDWLKTLKVMDSIARYPRERSNKQKGQENPITKCSDCDKEQKISADTTTQSPASNMATDKAQKIKSEKGKETSEKEGTRTEMQQDR